MPARSAMHPFPPPAQGRQFYEKPSEQRKKAASLAERRFKRAEFQEMLGWIMRRRSRGF